MSIRSFEDKKIRANSIALNFITAEEEAKSFCKKLDVLQKDLCSAKTQTEFDSVAKKLITQGKEVHQFLSTLAAGKEQETKLALTYGSKYVGKLSKYIDVVTESVSEKNESVALEEILKNLADTQKNEVRNFIKSLKELQPVSETLMSQEEKFKERLSQADSSDVVDMIEAEILAKNNIIEGSLNRLISYPQDEAVAGALVNFLQRNERLLNIMQSFDIYASLEDDLSNARAALPVNNRSLRS
ncbi:hypothetical protein [Legionella cincinnatiensis]|uniref:Uncharacterized protein n=1 Tax=Legionella cincinnatiensis TaxID=28085 RepID=A0A378IGW2_9GAMM|nr:hypothetical protein [Legionella cincinnatiensis]KTC92667.1 hypothetical protein Lcin_0577 [Legionella cincinnatiensis]STX34283.1 Uncharacterised protein [Legionella cincinnatiensis]